MSDITSMPQKNTAQAIDRIIQFVFGAFFILFPLVFSTATTEAFVLPKQILLGITVAFSLLLFGAKVIAIEKIKIRRTPFDLPISAFTLIALISAILAPNRADALTAFVPLLFSILAFFLVVNFTKTASQFHFLLTSFLIGGALSSIWTILAYFKIYPLSNIALTQAQNFTPMGAQFDQAIYLVLVLLIGWYMAKPTVHHIKEKSSVQKIIFPILTAIVLLGFGLTLYQTVSPKNPADKLLLLPLETGFQTGLSSISQDQGRLIWGLLFGSGYGTFITDYTRFKNATFNANPDLWFITFFRSSSFVLEIMATMGILGLISYLFLVVRVLKNAATSAKSNGLLPAVLVGLIISFVLPFSFNVQAILFFVLALYASYKGLFDSDNFFDIEIDLVALKKGLLEVSADSNRKTNKALPVGLFIVCLVFIAIVGFFTYRYVAADILFQKSLLASAQNKGVDTYNYEVNAISLFPYRDGFYRIYSQTNLALANSIAAAQPKGQTPNQQTQQTVYTLIQQAITAGRSATSTAPQTYLNWENLSSIYRSLIGFGQNADTFAIASEQQAVTLNPNDPQVYINLGGIYFQVGKWDDAQRQFQLAANLKNDYANAHYNLGHALEQKGDLQGALSEYEAVATLVQNNPNNLSKINGEIAALRNKMGQANSQNGNQQGSNAAQPPLGISKPQTQLPEQHPPVALPTP